MCDLNQVYNFLNKDYLLNIDIIVALQMNIATVEYFSNNAILVYLPKSEAYYIYSPNNNEEETFDHITRPYFSITTRNRTIEEKIKQRFDLYHYNGHCHNIVWSSKKHITIINDICTIKTLTVDNVKQVASVYKLYDATEEITENILNKNMLGAFIDDKLVGFVGYHSEGAMGMLEVLPEYRKMGIGKILASSMINKVIDDGYTPFGQVFETNTASIELNKKLGFEFSVPDIIWLCKS